MLLIHGSAADHTTWSIQLASASLTTAFELIAYDRRLEAATVEAHADDAAQLIAGGPRALVVGSSFGAVIALDMLRRHAALCAGAILIEPPLPANEALADAGRQMRIAFEQRLAEVGGPAAAELFLRVVLGEATFDRMPRVFRERATARWAEIRADSVALVAYGLPYDELATVDVPVLLLGGDRSASYFRPTLERLASSLPRARFEIVAGAGHMLHAEAHRRFAELLRGFAAELGLVAPSM